MIHLVKIKIQQEGGMLRLLESDSHMMRVDKAGETLHRSIGVGFNICCYTGNWFNAHLSRFVYCSARTFIQHKTPYEGPSVRKYVRTPVCVWYKMCVC